MLVLMFVGCQAFIRVKVLCMIKWLFRVNLNSTRNYTFIFDHCRLVDVLLGEIIAYILNSG